MTSTENAARPDLAPRPDPDGRLVARVRAAGAVLVVGAVAFAATPLVGDRTGQEADVTATIFQLGIWGLVLTMWWTGAAGSSRFARVMVRVEIGLLAMASLASVLLLLPDEIATSTPVVVIDMFWPLSMLGMAVLGVTVAVAGRWRGVLRFWPAVAETWALFAIPAYALGGETAGEIVGTVHLLAGYATLGVLLMVRPRLTGAR